LRIEIHENADLAASGQFNRACAERQ
jgi:hypothetical protein